MVKRNSGKRLLCLILAIVTCMSMVFAAQTAFAFDKVIYANADPWKYFVELDLTNKITTVYERDSKGKYTKIAKQFISTTGTNETPTPEGSFVMNDSRRRFGYFRKFDVYAQYWSNVAGGIYFHSILYREQKEGTFTSTSYRALGKQASHGCIRMLVEDARWIYYNCPAGTRGVIVSKKKDEVLRKSLLPKTSADRYKPTSDEYEAAKRDYAKAKIKWPTTFTPVSGQSETIEKGTIVKILSSGGKTCRVRVGEREGHIETHFLEFYPNGPKDKQIAANSREVYEVSSEEAPLYRLSSVETDVLGTYGKNTTVKVMAQTASFYQVEMEGVVGFMLKTDMKARVVSNSYQSVIHKIEHEESADEEWTEDEALQDAEDDKTEGLG